ncbi:MAG TPA: hypothetical protein VM241_03370 [Candidatus Thermoplasmatota archaeon]|nr:hypothetical protein [Candidatus Thermoplasmatota archaeon]
MGTVVEGTAVVAGRTVKVHADFASDHVVLRGGLKGEHPYATVAVVSSAGGILRLQVAGAVAEFPLEEKADGVAQRIRNPPTVLDKLGLRAGLRVHCIALPADLQADIDRLGVLGGRASLDAVLLGADKPADLARIAALRERLAPEGALWVIYPKGRRDPGEADVIAAGRDAGLKDVKAARVSATHTGLKFVIPLSQR